MGAKHTASSPADFWNNMTPAERLEFIIVSEKRAGETIGHSNSKQRYDKIVNKHLIKAVEDSITTKKPVAAKKTAAKKIATKKATPVKVSKTTKKSPKVESPEQLRAILENCIINVLNVEPSDITDDAHIQNDLGADSLDAVEIIMCVEKDFDIDIADEDVENLMTVSELYNYIHEKVTGEKFTKAKDSDSDELDLCISFDDTGSMSSVRKQVRNHINELVKQLFTAIPNLRVSIIIHNDYCDMPRHIFTMDFTSDLSKIEKFVNSDSPCGGGDSPECYELALQEASKMSWKSDRRALIMIGDEVPHHVGYRYGSHTNHIDWMKETKALADMDVKVYGVQALGRRSSNSFYENISRITGGIKLDLSQFQHISTYINAIAYHQSGQLDTYQSSDPSFNTNIALKNMFNRLKGGVGTLSSEKIELLSKFQVMKVDTDGETTIRDFVEMNGCTFSRGKGYYQLIERTADGKANSEIIQADKEVLFINKSTGEAISDTNWCREQLGVPYGVKATVRPLSLPDVMSKYEIFVQSNSYTRKLDPGCKFLYELEAR
jgi:acyl carrier protein